MNFKSIQSRMARAGQVLSIAFPLFAGSYLGIYLCNTLSACSTYNELLHQLRIKVVDIRSQPLSGTNLNCPGLGIKGTTDTFGEITIQARQKSFSICQLTYSPSVVRGLSRTHFRLVSAEKDRPVLIAMRGR